MGHSENHSENMSPESSSSLFPDRPIRPLPKRRLRERLSPDVADSIQYPPVPQTSAPLFAYPSISREDLASLRADPPNVAHRENAAGLGQDAGGRRNGLSNEQGENSLAGQARRAFITRPTQDTPGQHATRAPLRATQRQPNPQAPPSTASSVDGYDSFENSNNKKKRKIPTAGETMLNGTHALNDLGTLGMSSPSAAGEDGSMDASGATSASYYQSGGSAVNGQGISGPGRGRYGRVRNGKSPLRTLSDPSTSWGNRNSSKLRTGVQPHSPAPPVENTGIISSAIASAEKFQVPPGRENISLLHQEASTKSSPTSAQFTFTFDSQNPVSWPGSDPAPSEMENRVPRSSYASDFRNQYSGSSSRAPQPQHGLGPPGSAAMQPGMSTAGAEVGKGTSQANATPKKPKRRGNSLLQAAKQRRRETEYQNFHHPPASGDIWICEFCEYERIFGRPPEALIRQYEIKDRRRRREEAERHRLLEKAKSKSRKGKKANKGSAKNNAGTSGHNASSGQQAPPPPPLTTDHDDQMLRHRQIHEDQENGYESDDRYGDQGPEEELPVTVPPRFLPPGEGQFRPKCFEN